MNLQEIYQEALIKVNEQKCEMPTTEEEYAHNGALDRVMKTFKNYVNGEGLFQIGKEANPSEDLGQIYSWVRCECTAGKCLFAKDLASLAHNSATDVALSIVNYMIFEKKGS